MYNRFDEECQKILINSKFEKKELKHQYISSEHIVLSILKNDNELSKILNKYNLNYKNFKKEIINSIGYGNCNDDLFVFTPLVKRILEVVVNESRENHTESISIFNLFLSILEEGEGIAIKLMLQMKIDLDKIYSTILKKIDVKKNTKKKSILEEIGTNLNEKAKIGKLDPVIGREKEIERILEILCRRTKNNPILLGDAGVGKTAIVEELANRIVNNNVPEILKNKKIISLDMASSVAGTKYRGEFEERMKKILSELEEDEDIIIFIDEIHTIMGAGGAEGAIDASNIFKPALARGKMRCIGATTKDEYKKYIENDSAIDRRFQKIYINEPNQEELKEILLNLKHIYEKYHKVNISENIIDKILFYSKKYIKDRNEPDKSIDILDEVCSKVSLKENTNEKKLKELEKKLKKLTIKKNEYISNNDFKSALLYKEKEDSIKNNINKINIIKSNKYKNVKEEDIINVIKSKIDTPNINFNKENIDFINKKLKEYIYSQNNKIDELNEFTKMVNLSNSCLSLLICGNTGVGKSLLANQYAELLVGKNNIIKIDSNDYKDSYSVNKIIGLPPEYAIQNNTKCVLDKIKEKPYSVIIIDEIEKCNKKVIDLFLQILNEGVIKNSKGKEVSFENVIFIMTSNINLNKTSLGFNDNNNDYMKKIKTILGNVFVNKINKIIILNNISEENITNIILKNIKLLEEKYSVSINLSKNVINQIKNNLEFETNGVSKLKDFLKNNIECLIFDNIINDNYIIEINNLNLISI